MSKKPQINSSRVKKTTKKRSPATKKKGSSARKKNSNLKYRYDTKSVFALIFSVVSFIISISILIYVLLDDDTLDTNGSDVSLNSNTTQIVKQSDNDGDFFEENEFLFEEKENIEHEKIYEPKKEIKQKVFKKISNNLEKKPKKIKPIDTKDKEQLAKQLLEQLPKKKIVKKDKLAIIIDDISFEKHLAFLKLNMNINLSFLPPTKNHKNSAKLAQKLDHYLVHLPCQAKNKFFKEEADTLHIDDSYQVIDNRIKYLKKIYPKVKVMNNHTGSLFTQNKAAMDKLMRALYKYHIKFIDSRTTAKSVAMQSALKYHVPILSRNVFLDNKRDKDYIKKNIIKSVKLAHKYGQAIAIGHPYKLTLQSIKELKQYLNKEVDLVLVDDLKFIQN